MTMPEYHIGCGFSGIFAGTIKRPGEWKDKSDCTDEAIKSVLQYMLDKADENGTGECVYTGKTVKGRTVHLIARFVDEDGDQQ